jgi:hypothetical protein
MAKNETTETPRTDGPKRALVGAGAEFCHPEPVPLNPTEQQCSGKWEDLDWFKKRTADQKVARVVMDRALALNRQHAGPQRGWELARAREELRRQLELMDEQERKWREQSGRNS